MKQFLIAGWRRLVSRKQKTTPAPATIRGLYAIQIAFDDAKQEVRTVIVSQRDNTQKLLVKDTLEGTMRSLQTAVLASDARIVTGDEPSRIIVPMSQRIAQAV